MPLLSYVQSCSIVNLLTLPTQLKALEVMRNRAIPAKHPHVNFAQLRGIADHLTLGLANAGVNINKLVPYGPMENIMPYLHRRVQENSSVLGGAELERDLLWKEIQRRKMMETY